MLSGHNALADGVDVDVVLVVVVVEGITVVRIVEDVEDLLIVEVDGTGSDVVKLLPDVGVLLSPLLVLPIVAVVELPGSVEMVVEPLKETDGVDAKEEDDEVARDGVFEGGVTVVEALKVGATTVGGFAVAEDAVEDDCEAALLPEVGLLVATNEGRVETSVVDTLDPDDNGPRVVDEVVEDVRVEVDCCTGGAALVVVCVLLEGPGFWKIMSGAFGEFTSIAACTPSVVPLLTGSMAVLSRQLDTL